MIQDRRTTVGILAGLLTLALPRAASAQQPPIFNPNAPGQVPPSLPPSALPPAVPPPSALPPSKVPSAAISPRDVASQKAVSDVLEPLTRWRRADWREFELADGGILLVENGRAFRLDLRAAPDSLYELSRSGTITVQGGRAVAVGGRPGAVMAPIGLA
jgi:hypothetical protein